MLCQTNEAMKDETPFPFPGGGGSRAPMIQSL